MKKRTPTALPYILTLILAAAASLSAAETPTAERTNALAKPKPAPGTDASETAPFILFLTTNPTRQDISDATLEIPYLYPHRAVLWCKNITPAKTYQAHWSLKDPAGKDFPLQSPDLAFTPDDAVYYIWLTVNPLDKPLTPGVWTWHVTVKGITSQAIKFTVLPPQDADTKFLALHEQAREFVFQAFACFWLAHEDSYFIVTAPEAKGGQRIIQVSGLSYSFSRDYVSEADSLNGITYKGQAAFTFDVYREFSPPKNSWTDWSDTTEYANEIFAFLGKKVFRGVPQQYQEDFNLNFTIQQRDSHWKITTDDKTVFIDGKLTEGTKHLAGLPMKATVVQLLLNGDTPRKRAKAIAEQVQTERLAMPPEATNTVNVLRGRPLR